MEATEATGREARGRRRSPIPMDAFEASDDETTRARTVPPESYTSEEFFQFEMEAVFRRDWVMVGRTDQLKESGDYFARTVAGEPIVVVRQEDGQLAGLSSVCRHRAAVIVEGEGNCGSALRCPYHWWTYDLGGALTSAPYMTKTEDFSRDEQSLPRFPLHEWHGFVFAYIGTGEPPDLARRLKLCEDFARDYGIDSLAAMPPTQGTYDANWKIIVDNANECYHCSLLHCDYHQTAPSKNTLPTPLTESDLGVFIIRVENTEMDTDFVPNDRGLFPAISTLSDEERAHSMWIVVAPNLMLSFKYDHVHYRALFPTSASTTDVVKGYLYPQDTLDMPDFEWRSAVLAKAFEPLIEEDNDMNRRVQIGLQSRYAPRGQYSWLEDSMAMFYRWLISKYRTLDMDGSA